MNIPLDIINSKKLCVVGLVTEAERLFDIRRNRLNSLRENEASDYTDIEKIRDEVERSKKIDRNIFNLDFLNNFNYNQKGDPKELINPINFFSWLVFSFKDIF